MESGSFLTTHLDILFSILSLLSTEDLARAKLVCRAWFNLMTQATFLHAHCTRPTPITAFFIQNQEAPVLHNFKPLSDHQKFPSSILGFLEENQLISTNHGLLCFRNGYGCFVVGNPATYMWTVLQGDVPAAGFSFHGGALIFNPDVSYHFKLAVAMIKLDASDLGKQFIRLHIYSSETCSWTVSSSVFTETRIAEVHISEPGTIEYGSYYPCNVGGGSVCWINDLNLLVGYEIATDTYWETPLPVATDKFYSVDLMSYNGDVYYMMLGSGEGRVLRLEEKDRWVLEGEAKKENLSEFGHVPFAYDKARGALLFGGRRNNEVCAFYLSSSKVEFIVEGEGPWCQVEGFGCPQFPHANTMAPFYGGELTNWG